MNELVNIEYLESKNGEITAKINDYLVHSKYNPKKEAQQLVASNYKPHHVHIVFGYGCGYVIDELLKRRAFNEKVIIIDPLFSSNLLEIKHQQDNLFFYDSSIIGKLEYYFDMIAPEARVSFKTFCTPNYDKIFPETYKSLLLKVRAIQYKNRTNDYTIIRYSKVWQRNFLYNLANLLIDSNISVLHKIYNCPVVVASGGPSLNKQISLLKKYRDYFILICAGSTINSLISNDIEPDYVVTIDGGEPNYKHFKDLQLKKSKIIYSMQHHYKINNSFEKKGYVIGTQGFEKLHQFLIENLGINLPVLELGGSVAHSAFNIAHYITNGPIALIGQDLAFTDNLTHANSNKNARKIDEDFIKKNEAFLTEGYYGEQVWTTPVFNSMKMDFEALLAVFTSTVPYYNCTEGGVKINGFPQIPFEEFLKNNVSDKKIEIVNAEDKTCNFELENLYKNIKANLENLRAILLDGLEILGEYNIKLQYSNKELRKLDKIEKKVQKLINILPIEPMTLPITIDILQNYLPEENESPEESFIRVNAQAKKLYNELLKVVDYTTNLLKDRISEMECEGIV